MRRRHLLSMSAAGITAGVVGVGLLTGGGGEAAAIPERAKTVEEDCIDDWCYSITIDATQIEPGTTETLTIEAENIGYLQWRGGFREVGISDYGREHANPEPTAVNHLYPPIWHWEPNQDVEIQIPIFAKEYADTGMHQLSVDISKAKRELTGDNTVLIGYEIPVGATDS